MPVRAIKVLIGANDSPISKNPEPLNVLDSCLEITKSDRTFRMYTAIALKPLNLSLMQWLLLSCVNCEPDKGVSHVYLSRKLGISGPQVTVLITYLIKLRMLRQSASRYDMRKQTVTITTKGQTILDDADDRVAVVLKKYWKKIPDNYLVIYKRVLTTLG